MPPPRSDGPCHNGPGGDHDDDDDDDQSDHPHLRSILDNKSSDPILVLDHMLDPAQTTVALEQVAREVDRAQRGDVRLQVGRIINLCLF